MTDYTVLTGAKSVQGSIANWVNRSDLPVTTILEEAEAAIYETLRVREMTARTTFSWASGVQTASLPNDFLDPISFRPYTWLADLPFVHENGLTEYRNEAGTLDTGDPARWTIIGTTAYLNVLPTAAYSGILLYYGQPAALSGSNTTNFLTTRYPSLLRYACMAKAYEHMKQPDQAMGYTAQMAQAIQKAGSTNDMWRRNQFILS